MNREWTSPCALQVKDIDNINLNKNTKQLDSNLKSEYRAQICTDMQPHLVQSSLPDA